jgi:hypothetical protein
MQQCDASGNMMHMDAELLATKWEAGLLAPERIPAVAVQLMEAGFDSPSLREAAGLLPSETSDAHQLFAAALRELGLPRQRSEQETGSALEAEYAWRVLDGRLAPYEGRVPSGSSPSTTSTTTRTGKSATSTPSSSLPMSGSSFLSSDRRSRRRSASRREQCSPRCRHPRTRSPLLP